ncbi:MAG: M18 family aminopeptidase [Clostridium sp.]|nr:M18 family aminopeptidase [Clostridium sp.]MCM1172018.1 M18 family aminopeptidase [Clostridium sp.]MCM1208521.1 M18 family aminopeptidase [Ruminococcus sp.]
MNTLKNVICEGVSPFHVVRHVKEQLRQCGFEELDIAGDWHVEENHAYIITPYPSLLMAVSVGSLKESSVLRMATAHTDSPCLKIKSNPKLEGKHCLRLNVEPYGGLIKCSWFDRPLGVAGKLVLEGMDAFHPEVRYVSSGKGICTIPSLAPHLDKDKKSEMDIQKEMMPVFGLENADFSCVDGLLDYDLYLYNPEQPEVIGIAEGLISSPRLDNLASAAALMEAMQRLTGVSHNNISAAVMFDNEEIGSRSKQGADSILLLHILETLAGKLGLQQEKWLKMLANGFLLSMDGAQGFHPNYPEKSDPTNPVYLGEGIVIKTSATQRYVSDSEASAVIKKLCQEAGISWQQQVNRSGMPGGQTLGPITSSYFPMLGADVGIPMLAMHSARELAACEDYESLRKLAEIFYRY